MRPYRHTCFLLCRCTAVVAAVALLCIGFSSCSGGKKYGDERTPEHQAALKRLDDSMFVKSDNVLDTMLLGLKKSSDSLDYYDYYLRYLRYSVSLDIPDTLKLDWEGPFSFLERQSQTPRVRGMLGFFV